MSKDSLEVPAAISNNGSLLAEAIPRPFGRAVVEFRVEGGHQQQANCLGVHLSCLPATLKQDLKTLLEGTHTVHLPRHPNMYFFFQPSLPLLRVPPMLRTAPFSLVCAALNTDQSQSEMINHSITLL